MQVDGVPANHLAINEGLYPYALTLYFYTDRQRETKEVKDLLDSFNRMTVKKSL